MAVSELDKLIVEHLADIDAATQRLAAIEIKIFQALDSVAAAWAKKNRWAGKFDYLGSGLWLFPPEWHKPGARPEFGLAYFEIDVGAGDTVTDGRPGEDCYYLTRLCRVGFGRIGFRFQQEFIRPAHWKRQFKDLTHLVEGTRFTVDIEPSFFLPFQLEQTKLAEVLGEEFPKTALTPFEEALKQIASARAAFDAVVAAINPAKAQSRRTSR